MWQFPNEPDGIGDQDREVLTELDSADQCVERGKQSARHQSVFLGKGAEQRGFTGIGVTDQGHEGQSILTASFSMQLAMFPDLLDVAFERAYAMPDLAAVHFQLGLTRAARTNTAAKSR